MAMTYFMLTKPITVVICFAKLMKSKQRINPRVYTGVDVLKKTTYNLED